MPLPIAGAIGARTAIAMARRFGKRVLAQRGLPAVAGTTVVIGGGIGAARGKPSPFPRGPGTVVGGGGGGRGRGGGTFQPEWGSYSKWYKKDGTPRRIKKNGLPWDKPSMNVANAKALGRSLRRLEGFKSLVKRVEKILPGRQFTKKRTR